jgi:GNAT superfamily N-acetyltransferase
MLTREYPKIARLRDGREVMLRPLSRQDFDGLYEFFQSVPEGDRLFLADDVTDPKLIRRWTEQMDLSKVIPILALDGDRIVGDGTLHMQGGGWMRHVGRIRLVTAPTHRRTGLGHLIARELVALAEERGLEKLEAQVIEDAGNVVRMFEAVGFAKAAVVAKLVKDQNGHDRNLAIMINDVGSLARRLEDWIQDTMVPAYRVPGQGA